MFTEKELAELREYDALVEKGVDLYPLTEEQKKASKQARQTHTGVYTFTKRERKPNDDKREIMEKLKLGVTLLQGSVSPTIEIINPEREMTFIYNGKPYKVTLTATRVKAD